MRSSNTSVSTLSIKKPLSDGLSFVKLEDHAGTDLDVVNAARVSFAKQSLEYGDSEASILRFLMREKHGSPFEHNYMKFRVRAPVVVLWEWVRHRIGVSYNVESGRYTELRDAFYIPAVEHVRMQVGKPGNYVFEQYPNGDDLLEFQEDLQQHSCDGFDYYTKWIGRGIAKEQARLFLGFNLYTEFYFTCNARSLMSFLALRNSPHAMLEIRKYAEALEDLWSGIMPDTYAAFITTKRIAP